MIRIPSLSLSEFQSQSYIANQQTFCYICFTVYLELFDTPTLQTEFVASGVHQYVIYLCCCCFVSTYFPALYQFTGTQKLFVTTYVCAVNTEGGQIPKNKISKLILTFGFNNASNEIKKLRALNGC